MLRFPCNQHEVMWGTEIRSPLILSFVLGVVSHLSKIQMYCWTFNPANHAMYCVTNS